jgi:hypothetical protein
MNPYTDVGYQPINLYPDNVNIAVLPTGIATTQQGTAILQAIFAYYVNNVTNCAQTPARIRYLNEACINEFQNQEVTIACADAMEFAKLALADNSNWQPNSNDLQAFVNEVVLFRVAYLISTDQNLINALDNTQYNEVMILLEKYKLFKEKVEIYRQRSASGGMGMGGAGSSMMSNSRILNNMGNRGTSMMRSAPQGSFAAAPFSGGGTMASAPPTKVYKKKFVAGQVPQTEEPYQHQHRTHSVKPVVIEQQAVEVKEIPKWAPSAEQPYFLLFDSDKETYDLVKKDKAVYFNIREYKEGEQKVDRGQHQIKSVSQLRSIPPTKWSSRLNATESTLMAATVAIEKPEEVQTEDEKQFIAENIKGLPGNVFNVDSLSEAVKTARIVHKKVLGEDYIATCFRTEFKIRNVFVTMTDQLPIFKNFASYGNFAKIAQEMTKVYKNASGGELNQNIARLDRYLTKHVNDLVRGKLSLKFEISSFMEDADAIEAHIRKHYGDGYADLFVQAQADVIADVMNFEDYTDDETDTVVLNSGEGEDETKLHYFGPTRRVSVTTVDLLADELKLGFYDEVKDLPALIRASTHPYLFEFAKATLTSTDALRSKAKTHYVVTADDVVYTLIKGLVSQEAYLIRKVS